MLITLLLILIFMICIGFLYPDGMWGNGIRLINVIIAALLAMNFYEPLAQLLELWWPSWTYCWDFIALWGIFTLSIVVLRAVTDLVSRVKVRFLKIVDQIGSAGFAALIGWVMVCFTLTTLHTAPLGQTFLFGSFQAGKPMFLGIMSPDQQWLEFTQDMSVGALSHSKKIVFDPGRKFFTDYDTRRKGAEEHIKITGTIRLGEKETPDNPLPPKRMVAPP